MKTPITDMFGIDIPILAFSHCRDVVAAVSKAGGMGVLGAVAHSPEQLEIDLAWIENEVGDRPYGIDVIVPVKYAGSDEGGYTIDDIRQLIPAEHIAFVEDILRRYDVPALAARSSVAPLAATRPFRSRPIRPTCCSTSRSPTDLRSSSTRSGLHPRT